MCSSLITQGSNGTPIDQRLLCGEYTPINEAKSLTLHILQGAEKVTTEMNLLPLATCVLYMAVMCRGESAAEWKQIAMDELTIALGRKPNTNVARNLILFLGDGMGIPTITAARIYRGQLRGKTGEETKLVFERFPNVALSKTYNDDAQVPDSAGTATAFLTGVKANSGTLGVDSTVPRKNCNASLVPGARLTTLVDWAITAGKSAGVVTTTRITHATPGAAYAKSADRDWESDANNVPPGCADIASQLVNRTDIQVILGGGRRGFLPESQGGQRKDNRSLVQEWELKQNGKRAVYVQDKTQFDAVSPADIDYLFGLFSSSHMAYEIERDPAAEPSLAEMTRKAISILSRNQKGFFLLVEGGRIDHGHHNSSAKRALHDVLSFEDAIGVALNLTNSEETLVVVTADHSHVFSIAGYPSRGNPIFGLVDTSDEIPLDKMPYTTLIYGNGPASVRVNLTDVDTTDVNYQQSGAVNTSDETHGGEDVAIFAQGPMGHLFHGVHEQHYIAHVMAYSACIGDYSVKCRPVQSTPEPCTSGSATKHTGMLYDILSSAGIK